MGNFNLNRFAKIFKKITFTHTFSTLKVEYLVALHVLYFVFFGYFSFAIILYMYELDI